MKRFSPIVLFFSLALVSSCQAQAPGPRSIPTQTLESTLKVFILDVGAIPEVGGRVLPESGEYSSGSALILNAIPSKGYVFENWSGDLFGVENSPQITLDQDFSALAHFSQLPTPTPTPLPSPTPVPCRLPSEITPDDAGQPVEVCGEVTDWGASQGFSFLELDNALWIISYDWVFNSDWIGDCLVVEDTVEILGNDPVLVFGHGEGFTGSECTYQDDGTRSCTAGDYFQEWQGCGDEQ